jgi:hypothetical protein
MPPAQTNFLCQVTLAKTRAVSPGPGNCAEDSARYGSFQLGLVASGVLSGFSEPPVAPKFPVTPTRDGHNDFGRTKLSSARLSARCFSSEVAPRHLSPNRSAAGNKRPSVTGIRSPKPNQLKPPHGQIGRNY